MIKSMTGFGKAMVQLPERNISVEVRILNSKQLDLNVRYPSMYREKEHEIRALAGQIVQRGKTDIFINTEDTGLAASHSINHELAAGYHGELKKLAERLGVSEPADFISLLVRMPDVVKSSSEEISDREKVALMQAVKEALLKADEFRRNEGLVLATDLKNRVQKIDTLFAALEPFEQSRMDQVRDRIRRDLLSVNELKIDENRFEQELIYYLEKIDVNEEKVRLTKHISYFIDTLSNDESAGRKLGFVAQEMGREINTIGSKANDASMQQLVVEMKDELEKIKEQVLNIL